jgi:hypothetical protein
LAIAEHIAQQLREPCTARPSRNRPRSRSTARRTAEKSVIDAMNSTELPDVRELIAGDGAAVLGTNVPGLAEIGGVELRGQLFNVFRVGCGRIIAAKAPRWA